MKLRLIKILTLLALIGALAGCTHESTPPTSPRMQVMAPMQAYPTLAPTTTPSALRLSQVALRPDDLPSGFLALDASHQAELGLTPALIAQSFDHTFHQAHPIGSFAFYDPDEEHFEVVIGILFFPLTDAEQSGFDHTVDTPIEAVKNFSQGFGGHAQWMSEFGHLGNSSVGWSFVNTSNPPTMQGEMVIARRGSVVFILMTLFTAGEPPPARLADLGAILDLRVKAGLENQP